MHSPVIHPEDDLLTLPEAARVLGVTPVTARIWALRGELAARQVGRMMWVRRVDAEALRAQRDSKTAASA